MMIMPNLSHGDTNDANTLNDHDYDDNGDDDA